ncbi:MAG TPA: NADH-quinone oxidoreductase subunit NuoE [Candidatus Sumerlaeota bacterium]|nr:MAG: NADH-quinone oxidoreductase subunit 2 [candidate division BRC1 bacterium ADurb.BinA292]HOE95864.1 NADH-quinone oxidoreductase subunit NuoE [Candidatus Sumerlaeota bacterium]HOR26657.1 NADH-quinone oxidoreductase subunit NuoE [Candidatus Sumerlaeota bacterium]HPK00533.1 NADH-quinone oxidoreductase subunit NuoE [Candidatus Hydrogenedentota bacterium]
MPQIQIQEPVKTNGVRERHGAAIAELERKYPTRRSLLLPVLWLIQEEDGWISAETMEEAAEICECTTAEVMEVVSFYQMYNRAPVGKYVLGICGTLPCALCAADGLYEYLKEKLGIGWNETTADGLFTIQRRECLGACSEAPVMLVNQETETRLTRAKVDGILEECRQGKRKPYFTGRNNKQ